MLDILTIVHEFADIRTAAMLRCTCRRLGALIPLPKKYSVPNSRIGYRYMVGNRLHRLDGPAVYTRDYMKWYRGGIEHREYHPQYIGQLYIYYMAHGAYHREVGASIIRGTEKTWLLRGLIHRKIGPADDMKSGGVWLTLDKLHRLDGPAYDDVYSIRGTYHRISCPMHALWLIDGECIR